MERSRFTESQIVSILKQYDAGVPVKDICRQAGLGLAQEADDLLFGKALLHAQSPSGWGLDSKSTCYSKMGGRRGGEGALRGNVAAPGPLTVILQRLVGRRILAHRLPGPRALRDDRSRVHGANFGLSAAAYQGVCGFPALVAHLRAPDGTCERDRGLGIACWGSRQ